MFSDLATIRTSLKTRLQPHLPSEWKIEPALKNPPTEYRNPLITIEFTRISSTANGAPLGPGMAAAGVDLLLGSPKTAEDVGETDVDELVLTLIQALDSQSDIFWDSAEKQRLDTGQWVWRIHTTVLTSSKKE